MTKSGGKVRLAIIGAGLISGRHAPAIRAHRDKIDCVAACDISEENLRQLSEKLGGGQKLFGDWKVMLREFGGQIDAVDICLPHHLHAPAILDAAAAGKHILCEKPMCINMKEADEIVAALRRSKLTYMSAHNELFMPVVREMKRLIDDGAVGPIRWLRVTHCRLTPQTVFRGKWRSNVKLQGGGVLIDTGYHSSYKLLHLAGSEPVNIRATMGRYHVELEGEDTASVHIQFANGAIGEILVSWGMSFPHGNHQLHVIGEKGQIYGSDQEVYLLTDGTREPLKHVLPPVETFEAEMEHFADCLLNGTRPIHSWEEGYAVLNLILKATEHAKGWETYAQKKWGASDGGLK